MPDSELEFISPDDETGGNGSTLPDDKLEALLLANARPGACPSPDLLFAAQEDVLPASEGIPIREHITHCALCQTLVSELPAADPSLPPATVARIRAHIQNSIDEHSTSTKIAGPPRKPIFWLTFAALAAVVIVGALSILNYRRSLSASKDPSLALNHPPTSPTRSLTNIPELHQLAPLAPPDDVPAMVMRGASATHGPTVKDLMPAFRFYNRGDFAQAASAFTPLVTRFPESDIPPLYLGISHLHLGQNVDAEHSLAQAYAITVSPHHNDAAWYLAVADLRLNQVQRALPLLRELCKQQSSSYAPRACTLAQQLGPS